MLRSRPLLALASAAPLFALAGLLASSALAEAPPSRETQIRAAVLLHLLKLVEWPGGVRGRNICLRDAPRLASALSVLLERQPQPVHVRELPASSARNGCDLIYLADPHEEEPGLQRSGLLSVSTSEAFLDRGGVVALIRSGGRLRFDLNLRAAHKAGLQFDPALLKLARHVLRAD
jgi:hypothetical protein